MITPEKAGDAFCKCKCGCHMALKCKEANVSCSFKSHFINVLEEETKL